MNELHSYTMYLQNKKYKTKSKNHQIFLDFFGEGFSQVILWYKQPDFFSMGKISSHLSIAQGFRRQHVRCGGVMEVPETSRFW